MTAGGRRNIAIVAGLAGAGFLAGCAAPKRAKPPPTPAPQSAAARERAVAKSPSQVTRENSQNADSARFRLAAPKVMQASASATDHGQKTGASLSGPEVVSPDRRTAFQAVHTVQKVETEKVNGLGREDGLESHATEQTAISTESTPAKHSIDLETVLQLTSGQNPQVAFARERIHEAFAQVDRAQVLWLPSLRAGITYDKHDGQAQQVDGQIIPVSRSALFSGFGGVLPGAATPAIPGLYANFQIADAVFQPRIAQRTALARQSAATAATNDAMLNSALAYLELLRALQDVAISRETLLHTEQLAEITRAYAETGKGTEADHDRVSAEVAVRKNDVQRSEEAILVASQRLAQQLSIDPQMPLDPREPTIVPIELVPREMPVAHLVAQGLSGRPEVCENRHLVGEAVERLKREQYAPLVPSVLLGIGYGGFGGGTGGNVSSFNNSFDSVAGAFWEVRNLGFGERAARGEARSRLQQAQWKEVAALDLVAREVVEAHTQVESRRPQIGTAQDGVRLATASYERNLERIRNVQGLPIEALQSIQALAQAQREYLRALIAYNDAQFRLHRALGWPSDRDEGDDS